MASRKIIGTTHIRRKLGKKAKAAIAAVAVLAVGIGGYFLITKSGISLNLNNKSDEIAIENSIDMEKALSDYIADERSRVEHTLNGTNYTITAHSSTLTSTGTKDEAAGGSILLSEKNVDNEDGNTTRLITLAATAKEGYVFQGWRSSDDSFINYSREITVTSSDSYTGDNVIKINGDTTFYAVFKNQSERPLLGGAANGSQYAYDFYTYPAIGTLNLEVRYKKDGAIVVETVNPRYDGETWWWINGDVEMEYVKFRISYPYSQAVTMWPVDQQQHTDDDHHDTYPHNKSVKGSFAIYVFRDGAPYKQTVISRAAGLGDQYSSVQDATFEIDLADVFGDQVKQASDFKIYVVPLMQQGANYQVYVSSDDANRGKTAGTAGNSMPFTTTIKAMPFEGYEFDYWRFKRVYDSNYKYIYDISSYNVSVQDPEVIFYTAVFKPATYKVYASNLPSDGGSIKIKGNVMEKPKDITTVVEKEGGPGELEYCYSYNTNSESSDYEKVTAKPKVHVTIEPKPGFEIESWSYSIENRGTVTGDSKEFDIVDFEQDINLQVKYTNGKARIEVKSSPVVGGTATVKNVTASGSEKYDYEEFLPGQEDALLTATPDGAAGYKFIYWKDSTGKKYDGTTDSSTGVNTLALSKVASNEKFTAYFAPENIYIKTKSFPEAGGSLKVMDSELVEDKGYKASANASVTLQATENSGYHFQKMIDGEGKEYSSNPTVIAGLLSDTEVTAVFVPDEFDITTISTPITGGSVDITVRGDTTTTKTGKNTVVYNDKVKLTAKPNTDYEFLYFEDQNGNRLDGDASNSLVFNAVNGAETYKAVFGLTKLNLNIDIDPSIDAGTVETSYIKANETSPTTVKDTLSFDDVKGKTDIKITAIEKSGYKFARFIDSSGQSHTDNPLILTRVSENQYITAVFIPDTFTISAQATPVTGGEVMVNDRLGSKVVEYGEHVTITATAKDGYIFKYFEDQHGTKYGGTVADDKRSASFKFNAVNGAETYKAVFGLAELDLSVTVDPKDKKGDAYTAGGFRIEYTDKDGNPVNVDPTYTDWTTDDITNKKVKGQSSVKITAVPGDGYHFVKFVDTDGNVYTENPLVYPDLSENKEVEVIFVPDSFTISAQATPVTGGTTDVAILDKTSKDVLSQREGSQDVSYDDLIRITATAKDGFIFRYFEDSHGTKYGGTVADDKRSASFEFNAVNGAETYKAVFGLAQLSLNVKVDEVVAEGSKYSTGGFKVDYTNTANPPAAVSDTAYEEKTYSDVAGGKSVKITAIPGDGYHFSKFVDTDGNVYTENPLVYPNLTENKDVEVIFVPDTFTISATASPSTGGSVDVAVLNDNGTISNKREGSNTVSYNDLVKLIAKPNSPGFDFRYFEDENGNKYGGKEETIDEQTCRTLDIKAVNGSEKYKAVFAISTITLNVKVDPNTKVTKEGEEVYSAGGFRVDYTNTSGTSVQSDTFYTEKGFNDIKGQTSVKITAVDGDGYHFSKFVDTDGNVYTENPLVYPDLVENKDVEIIFVPDRFTINAKSVPVTGGTVDVAIINKDTGEEISKREGSNEVSYNEKVRIIAKPSGNFAFRYFEDPNGAKYGPTGRDESGNPYFEFNAVNGAETYKAVFAMSNISLTVKVDPNTLADGKYEAGKFKVNYTYTNDAGEDVNTDIEGDKPGFEITNIKGQTSVKITAIELGGYKFSKFIDSEGNIWNDNPMVLGDLIENKEIEVIFVKEHWRIEGVSSPEAGGVVTLNGIESGVDVDYGDHVTIEAKENPGYRFKYFKDDLGNEFLANPIDFVAINGSEKYTAYFAKNDVNITLDLAPEGAGTVRFESEPAVSKRTPYSTGGKSSVTLTATPKEDVSFLYWRDQDGKMYNDNPLVLSDISADLIFTAVFDTKYDTIRAVASPASGGRIRKIVNDNGSITLVAIANRGYSFIRWQKPVGTATVYRLDIKAEDVHSGDLYTAIFRADSNYDWRSDITKEKFYREWRKVITPNYTVTRDSMKLLAMQSVAGLRQYDDATPPLRSYGAIANAQAYFDEKTARDAARLDGVFGDAELMTAEGDILRPDALPDADKYQQDAEDFTDRKFGDLYETEILTVKRVLEPDDFDNIKRTYLWRYTGAEYKDNIYLLYNIGGRKPDWATPIVDEDGVLKFTIDELDSYDVVAVVRVKIKEK